VRTDGAHRARRAIAEFVQFQYTSGHLGLIRHLKSLPREARTLAVAALILAGVAVVAMPLLAPLSRIGGVQFENVEGTESVISIPAFVVALAVFSVAWGYLLAALALGPGLIWIFGGLRYAFGMLAVGLAAGRSFWHVVPIALPVVMGALSAAGGARGATVPGGTIEVTTATPSGGRPALWSTVALAMLLGGVAVRMSPLPDAIRARWYLYCFPAGVSFFALHVAIVRWLRVGVHARALVGALGTLASFGVTWTLAGDRNVVHWFHIMLDNLSFWLQIVWFVLGAAFVTSAIEFGQFARSMVGVVAQEPVPAWTLFIVWGAAVAWIGVPEPGPARISALAVLGIAVAVLLARWRRRGTTREWLAGWLVASLAALLIVTFLSTYDVSDTMTREAGVLTVVGFVYALLWEVTGRIPNVPLRTAWFDAPAPLVFYLGVILLTCGATLFGIAANLDFFQLVVRTHQYLGAMTLWIPMLLLLLVRAWPRLPAPAPQRFVTAFAVGMLAGVPIFLARAAGWHVPDAWIDVILLLLAAGFVRLWPETQDPLVAGGVGVAATLGLAVHLTTAIPTVFLNGVFVTLGTLFGVPLFVAIASAIWEASRVPFPTPETFFGYFWLSPAVTGLIAAGLSLVLRRRPRARPSDQGPVTTAAS
jgi:hypothetical protein